MTKNSWIIDCDCNYGEFAIIKRQALRLNKIAIQQMRVLTADDGVKRLEGK